MTVRKITANYVFTLTEKPVKNGILVVDGDGVVIEVIDRGEDQQEIAGLEQYNGILCPGFVNAHCHLELSHLKNKIEKGIGLPDFLHQIFLQRKADDSAILKSARQADLFLFKSGVVAVGDVSNSSFSLEVKEKSQLYYHTFIEAFGFAPERAPRAMEYLDFVSRLYEASRMTCSVTPHSPYSSSSELFDLIMEEANKRHCIISLHHQESEEEDRLFRAKEGTLLDHYRKNLNIDTDFWKATGKSSTQSVVSKIPAEIGLLLVHNTYLKKKDVLWLKNNRSLKNTFLVTCPNANLYIENQLPDYDLLTQSGFKICIGTDSLASTHSLSVLNELITIQKNYPVEMNDLIRWACLNGAEALNIDNWAGTFYAGKKPGVNLISGIDLKNLKFTENAKVKRLI